MAIRTFGDVTVLQQRGAQDPTFAVGGEQMAVIALTAGEMELRQSRYRAGAAVIVPPGMPFTATLSDDGMATCYTVDGALQARLREIAPAAPRATSAPVFLSLLARLEEELRRDDVATPLVIESVLCEILARARRASIVQRSLSVEVAAALHYAAAHLSTPLRLCELAAAAGMSERSLSARFAIELRTSPLQYVRDLRIRFAARALRSTTASLGDISARCGFYDHAHFTRSFSRSFGMTPTEYRRVSRGIQNANCDPAVTPSRTRTARPS